MAKELARKHCDIKKLQNIRDSGKYAKLRLRANKSKYGLAD